MDTIVFLKQKYHSADPKLVDEFPSYKSFDRGHD